MYPDYHHHDDQSEIPSGGPQGGGDESNSGTRTPTQQSSRLLRTNSLYSSLTSQLLASDLNASTSFPISTSTSSPSSSSSSSSSPSSTAASPPTGYNVGQFTIPTNYLIENSSQANYARRTSLPTTIGSQLLPVQNSQLYQPSNYITSDMSQDRYSQSRIRGVESSNGFQCPNCSKTFARDDLLRRHLTREARAQAQPIIDRQKSCHECARSKARCDLEVPSCGRCRSRGKTCSYGARSGNPNVRKGMRETQEPSGEGPSNWREGTSVSGSSQWDEAPVYSKQNSGKDRQQSADESESDDSRQWVDPFQHYRLGRATSTSSASTNASYDSGQVQHHTQPPFDSAYVQSFPSTNRSESPGHYNTTMGVAQTGAGALNLARNFSGSSTKSTIDTSVNSSRLMGGPSEEEGEITPITRTNAASLMAAGTSTMRPPQTTSGRLREMAAPAGQPFWYPSVETVSSVRSDRAGEMQRPQPPRLLTGAKMPQPANRPGSESISARPLFSAQLDLSGWLEEPVIPSPLYRMGSSLSALAPSITPTRHAALESPSVWTGGGGISNNESLRSALAADHMPLPVVDTVMDRNNTSDNNSNDAVAAKQWWAHASDMPQSDAQVQGVAQICAGHFTIYPALMILPEASSPVPPLFHRPWLASSRLQTPASLARARVLLAGYHVKLPSSEVMVWELIATEANYLIASFDQHVNASDLEVFSTTAALWFLVILLLMSSDPSSGATLSETLIDSSLIGLSQYSRLLAQRINACEERKRSQGHSPSFLEWGFEETMKRTLFASYALLVLQRFRESSTAVQSQLAGIELTLHIPLPAPALEFEAGNELEWRACQSVQITEPAIVDGIAQPITIYHLLNARKGEVIAASGSQQSNNTKAINSYFDRHDDFTNVCLSVAFALDRNI